MFKPIINKNKHYSRSHHNHSVCVNIRLFFSIFMLIRNKKREREREEKTAFPLRMSSKRTNKRNRKSREKWRAMAEKSNFLSKSIHNACIYFCTVTKFKWREQTRSRSHAHRAMIQATNDRTVSPHVLLPLI